MRIAVLTLLVISIHLPAVAWGQVGPGRRTDDRQADLIQALIETQLLDEARTICDRYAEKAPRGSAEGAKWAVRRSAVMIEQALNTPRQESPLWEEARQVIQAVLTGYEQDPAAPWLQFQLLMVDVAQTRLLALKAQDNPSDQTLRDQFIEQSQATVKGLRQLDTELEERIPLEFQAGGAGRGYADDLGDLRASLQRRIVQTLADRIDVYSPKSENALAAAAAAETAATKLLEATPNNSPYREEIIRLLAQAKIDGQNPGDAADLLKPWIDGNSSVDRQTLALWLESQLARGDRDRVRRALAEYYGKDPQSAPRSVEMDLIFLRFLISELETTSDTAEQQRFNEQIASWVPAVGKRGGPFAQRRAEAEMLRSARVEPSEANATLLTAKAGQLLRGGQPEQLAEAARLLSQAADVTARSGDRAAAYRLALQSGAAFNGAGKIVAASQTIAAASVRFAEEPHAANYHFEAARLLAGMIVPAATDANQVAENGVATDRLEQLLLEHLKTWKGAETGPAVREWLLAIYESQRRWSDAAVTALQLDSQAVEWPQAIRRAAVLWRKSLLESDAEAARRELGQRAVELLDSLASEDASAERGLESAVKQQLRREADLLAMLTFAREDLSTRWVDPPETSKVDDESPQRFAAELRRLRVDQVDPQALALAIPEVVDQSAIVQLALERLLADGFQEPNKLRMLAAGMLRIATDQTNTNQAGSGRPTARMQFLIAVASAWSGDLERGVSAIGKLAVGPPRDGRWLQDGAAAIALLKNRDAALRTIEMWNRYSNGIPPGSEPWYAAKLATMDAMLAAGEQDKAIKLARYVLLTQPPQREETKRRLQQVVDIAP